MSATGRRRRWALGLALAAGALGSARTAVPADGAGEPSALRLSLSDARRVFGRGLTDAGLGELRAQARAAGELRIREKRHLSGRILAERLVVEAGAEVTVEPGTVIYASGDMRIDAPVVMATVAGPGSAPVARAAVEGAAGASAPKVTIACEGAESSIGEVIGTAGAAGQDTSRTSTTEWSPGTHGGKGGNGAGVVIVCSGSLTVTGTIRPGAGGRGGDAVETGGTGPGCSGAAAATVGGDGGDAGGVLVSAKSITVTAPDGAVALAPGGRGGDASSVSSKGPDGVPCDWQGGCPGGHAKAKGGTAGNGTYAILRITDPAGRIAGEPVVGSSLGAGARGGHAAATSANGGDGAGCDEPCPDTGRPGGVGGTAYGAEASGGKGQNAASVRVEGPVSSAAEGEPGVGGDAVARGGNGGRGGPGQSARHPGAGGKGGYVYPSSAFGGPGGNARTRAGGAGGTARVVPGDAGSGGRGGACCDNPGGAGAPGGAGEKQGAGYGTRGRGGKGKPNGLDGALDVSESSAGSAGPKGADCPGTDGANTLKVTEGTGTGPGTLPAALAAAQPGDTIEIDTREVQWPITAPAWGTPGVTIDGKGHTITGPAPVVIDAPGVTLESVTLDVVSLQLTENADGFIAGFVLIEGGCDIDGAQDVTFKDTSWTNLTGGTSVTANGCSDLSFLGCKFTGGDTAIAVTDSTDVEVIDFLIRKSRVGFATERISGFTLIEGGCDAEDTGLYSTDDLRVLIDSVVMHAMDCVTSRGSELTVVHSKLFPSPAGGIGIRIDPADDLYGGRILLEDCLVVPNDFASGVVATDFDYLSVIGCTAKGRTTGKCFEIHPTSGAVVEVRDTTCSGAARGIVVDCGGETDVACDITDCNVTKCPDAGIECVGGDGGTCTLENDVVTKCGTLPGGAAIECTPNGDDFECRGCTLTSNGGGIVLTDLAAPNTGQFDVEGLTATRGRGDAISVGAFETMELSDVNATGNRGATVFVRTGGRVLTYPHVLDKLMSPKLKTPGLDFEPRGWGTAGVATALDEYSLAVDAQWPAVGTSVDAAVRSKSKLMSGSMEIDGAGHATLALCDAPAGALSIDFSATTSDSMFPVEFLGEVRVTRPKGACPPPPDPVDEEPPKVLFEYGYFGLAYYRPGEVDCRTFHVTNLSTTNPLQLSFPVADGGEVTLIPDTVDLSPVLQPGQEIAVQMCFTAQTPKTFDRTYLVHVGTGPKSFDQEIRVTAFVYEP